MAEPSSRPPPSKKFGGTHRSVAEPLSGSSPSSPSSCCFSSSSSSFSPSLSRASAVADQCSGEEEGTTRWATRTRTEKGGEEELLEEEGELLLLRSLSAASASARSVSFIPPRCATSSSVGGRGLWSHRSTTISVSSASPPVFTNFLSGSANTLIRFSAEKDDNGEGVKGCVSPHSRGA